MACCRLFLFCWLWTHCFILVDGSPVSQLEAWRAASCWQPWVPFHSPLKILLLPMAGPTVSFPELSIHSQTIPTLWLLNLPLWQAFWTVSNHHSYSPTQSVFYSNEGPLKTSTTSYKTSTFSQRMLFPGGFCSGFRDSLGAHNQPQSLKLKSKCCRSVP